MSPTERCISPCDWFVRRRVKKAGEAPEACNQNSVGGHGREMKIKISTVKVENDQGRHWMSTSGLHMNIHMCASS